MQVFFFIEMGRHLYPEHVSVSGKPLLSAVMLGVNGPLLSTFHHGDPLTPANLSSGKELELIIFYSDNLSPNFL